MEIILPRYNDIGKTHIKLKEMLGYQITEVSK